MQYLCGLLVVCLSLLGHVYPIPITSNSTANETLLQNENDKCFGKDCPDGKTCIVDESANEGFKCCKNKKCGKMKCKDPGEVENAKRIPLEPRKFNPNETVIYDCEYGFYFFTKRRRFDIRCVEDGTWEPPKPTCIEIDEDIIKSTPLTITTTVPESQPSNVVLIVVIFLLLLCLMGIAVALFFRYKNRNNRYMGCRQRSHPVVLENVTFPTMPDKLEEGAIAVNEFAQYVALGHANADQKFREEFEEIQNQSIGALTWETSLLPENQDKNRYINIVAYDHSRVCLKPSSSHRRSGAHHSTDYINGNYVSSYEKPKAYIACQGPMPNTYNEFWRMIWENNVTVIVMITNLLENGRRKCDQYWPRDGREQYKHICVTLRDVDVYANYTVRSFQVRNTKQSRGRSRNNERRVLQFHYTQWPDHGTPEYILPLLSFIRRSTVANAPETSPIIVHCSAGVGRTGAYIMLHSMIQMASAEGKININKFLRFIRIQRNYLVQTEDQYIFLHDALLCEFSCGNTECPAQQLTMYVENLLAPPVPRIDNVRNNTEPVKESENGILASAKQELIKMSPGKNRNGMQRQFMIVAQYARRDIDYDFALRSVNQQKNRPNAVLPIFRSRVPLFYRAGIEGSEYINASFLQGYRNCRMFIVTQLPLQNTRKDFWQLVWDHNCSVVITIRSKEWNELTDKFWPGQDHHMTCSAFNVSFSSENKSSGDEDFGLTVRDFVLEATKDDYVLAVTQLDISKWPSLDELDSSFVRLLNTIVRHTERKDSSIIIQDRYGGTPAGQLACIHSLHQQLANENTVDVFQTARVAYQMRPGIFSTHADLHFIYKAMLLEANPSMFRTVEAKSDNKEKASSSNGKSLFVHEESSADTKPLLDKSDDASCKTEEISIVETKSEIQNKAEDVECVPLEKENKKDESSSDQTVTEEMKTESENLSPTVDFFKDMNDSVASESALLLKN